MKCFIVVFFHIMVIFRLSLFCCCFMGLILVLGPSVGSVFFPVDFFSFVRWALNPPDTHVRSPSGSWVIRRQYLCLCFHVISVCSKGLPGESFILTSHSRSADECDCIWGIHKVECTVCILSVHWLISGDWHYPPLRSAAFYHSDWTCCLFYLDLNEPLSPTDVHVRLLFAIFMRMFEWFPTIWNNNLTWYSDITQTIDIVCGYSMWIFDI